MTPDEKAKKREDRLLHEGCADCFVLTSEVIYEVDTRLYCSRCHEVRADSMRTILVLLRKESTSAIKQLEVLLSLDKG